MPALFPPWSNTGLRSALALLGLGALSVPVGLMLYVRTPWNTQQFQAVDQPVEFDHRHHVQDDHIDCIYCHSGAETSPFAGVPSTDVCMGCHAQIHSDSPLLEDVRRSYFSGRSVPWNRVHDLADFVYFDHAVHVRRGLSCSACHGAVDHMSRIEKVAPMTMDWCLDCHRASGEGSIAVASSLPAPVAPTTASSAMTEGALEAVYDPLRDDLHEVQTMNEYTRRGSITSLTTCTACHR